jgi:putative tricarboxylic transport membrane protein
MSHRGDFWSALALAGLGTYTIVQARGWVYMSEDGPGAGFFPLWYGVALLALSLVLLARSVRARAAASPSGTASSAAGRAAACWAALMVFIALLDVAGFVVALALLTWFIVAVMFRRPQRVALTVAIVSALAFQLVFGVGLGMPLPAGVWR